MRDDGAWATASAAAAVRRRGVVTAPGRGSGSRELKIRVKGGRARKLSSKLWLDRQLNDPYVARAKREGMRSRAAYKLAEIDDKARFLQTWCAGDRSRRGARRPGARSRPRRVGAPQQGRVVAIDLLAMDPLPGVEFAQIDFSIPPRRPNSKPCSAAAPTWCCQTWRPMPPATARPITSRSWRGRSRGRIRPRGAGAGRRVSRQGAARRHRSVAAGAAQARLRHRQAREAGGKPVGFGGALYLLATGFAARLNASA